MGILKRAPILRLSSLTWLALLCFVFAGASGLRAQILMSGTFAYSSVGNTVEFGVARISNYRALGTNSGTLAIQLWATAAPYTGNGSLVGNKIAEVQIGTLLGGFYVEGVVRTAQLSNLPTPGYYNIVFVLAEWSGFQWLTVDWGNFSQYQAIGNVAPAISSQPSSSTVTAGQTATFSVTATGTAPLSYQWRKDGSAISGATSSTLTLASVSAANAGTYTVVVTNSAGSVTSTGAVLTVNAAVTVPVSPYGAQLETFYPAPDGLHVRISTLDITETASTFRYAITYTLENRTSGRVIDEGTFKAFFVETGGTPQYGFFGRVFPGGSVTRSYTWEELKGTPFNVIAYGGGGDGLDGLFFASTPPSDSVKWFLQFAGLPIYSAAISLQPSSSTVTAGQTATFSVTATGTAPLSYQWRKDGAAISGATSSTLTLASVSAANAGTYTVVVTNSAGSVTSTGAVLVVNELPASRIVNVSIRTTLSPRQLLIVGLTMSGGANKNVLMRAVGPGLGAFGVGNAMIDPDLSLYDGNSRVAFNDNWGGGTSLATAAASVGAFPLASSSRDAALLQSFSGGRTLHVQGADGGNVLVEAYDAGSGNSPRLTNVSARNFAGSGGDTLIAGFVIAGDAPKRVLIRAVGPTLGIFGVPGAIADPLLEVYAGSNRIAQNDNWGGGLASIFGSVGAFALTPNSRDSALEISLNPGGYTVHVTPASGAGGEVLLEIYELP
jgi:uncharacterized protein YjdB